MIRILATIIGILSLIYFGAYAALAGLTNKFTYFWLMLGICCLAVAVGYNRIQKCIAVLPGWSKIVATVVVALCVLVLVIAEGMIISYGVSKPQPGADYVIVLGAQVRGRTPSYSLARRLDKAYEYLQQNPTTQVIVSGGQGPGEEITEAAAMAEYLESRGIAKERIILEEQSRNTYENIEYSRRLVEDEDASIVLVTNRFHVFRSVGIAKKQGMENVEGMGAPIKWYTIPNLYLREAFAVVKYALSGQI